MKKLYVSSAIVYTVLIVFCAFGTVFLPKRVQGLLRPYFWLLGLPANLVHGMHLLVPFLFGTLLVAALAYGLVHSRSVAAKEACGLALMPVWALFGFLVYAPGA